jgi:hypothetical protein
MDKSIRIQKSQLSQKLTASLLDLLAFAVSTLIVYIVILYGVFGTFFNYVSNEKEIKSIETSYNLNLKKNLSYKEYEVVIKDFYLAFDDEIVEEYNQIHKTNFSIVHIYNVLVLRLPSSPTPDNYKTTYFQYIQKQTGEFDPDQFATLCDGSGKVYEKNMHDIFYLSYKNLKILLEKYDDNYKDLKQARALHQTYSRAVSFILIFIIYFIVIPSKNKYYSTIFENKQKIAYVNQIDGYLAKPWKIIFKRLLLLIIPFFGFVGFSKYAIIILVLGSLFLNYLIMLFSSKNNEIPENMLKIESCSIDESLLFKSYKEEQEYFQKEESKEINDVDFLSRLENIQNISLPKQNNKK